jgi:transglutaminase-like putative cysteine protease
MTLSMAERHRLAVLGWLTTVATSLCLYTSMQQKRYVLIAALLSAVVVGIGMGLRQIRLPLALVTLVQILVPLWFLLVVYGHHAIAGIVPTPSTVTAVHHQVSAGIQVANHFTAPVPPSVGLTLVTVAFVVLIAIAVDLLAAGLGNAPIAGLPLLAMYVVPVASLPNGVPWLGFLPGAIAFVALLLLAERDRLAHWGRRVARAAANEGADDIDTAGLSATGRRISVLALTGAVLLPVLVPGLSHAFIHGSGGVGDGSGRLTFADPMVSLSQDLKETKPLDLIDVTSATTPTYVRLAVLDQPGPTAWRNSGVSIDDTVPTTNVLPGPTGLTDQVASQNETMAVQLTSDFPADSRWLPVPFDISAINLSQQPGSDPYAFSYVLRDQTVTTHSSNAFSGLDRYSVDYHSIDPSVAQLESAGQPPASIVTNFDTVPTGVPAVVSQVAHQVTNGATSQYEMAEDLQSFFRQKGEFTYDVNTGYGSGYQAMATFLQKRRGYCQHFAATMAMMARTLGIPSRVVVGFLAPSTRGPNDTWVFTSHDAHAWPELYFAGIGWVRFEPTPGNGAVAPTYTTVQHIGPVTTTGGAPTSSAGIIGKTAPGDTSTGPNGAPQTHHAAAANGGGGVPWLGWLIVLLVLLVLLAPGLVRTSVRRSRLARALDGGPSCEHAWLEVRDRIVDLGLPWSGSMTPRARSRYVEPLLGGDPDAVAGLDRLALTVERCRYADRPLPDASPASDARAILAALVTGVGRGTRLRAWFWPRSLMPEIRGSWSRLRTRLRRPRRTRPATS